MTFILAWMQRVIIKAASSAVERAQQTLAALQTVLCKFQNCSNPKQRYQLVLKYADILPAYPEDLKLPENRVLGCAAQVCEHQQRRPCAAICSLLLCYTYI